MKIKIYAIGHLKEAYLKQGINEYLERIKPYSQIEIVEVNDEPIPNNPSLKDIEIAKNKGLRKDYSHLFAFLDVSILHILSFVVNLVSINFKSAIYLL